MSGEVWGHSATRRKGTADFADWEQIKGVLAHAGRREGGLEAWRHPFSVKTQRVRAIRRGRSPPSTRPFTTYGHVLLGPTVSSGASQSGTSAGRAGGVGRTPSCRGVGQSPTPRQSPLPSSLCVCFPDTSATPGRPFNPRLIQPPAQEHLTASGWWGQRKSPAGRGFLVGWVGLRPRGGGGPRRPRQAPATPTPSARGWERCRLGGEGEADGGAGQEESRLLHEMCILPFPGGGTSARLARNIITIAQVSVGASFILREFGAQRVG